MANDSGQKLLRSLNNQSPTYVNFVNKSGRMVYLFWLDYHGKLVRYGHIPPRKGTSMDTFVTHPWIALDAVTGYPLMLNGGRVFHPEAERNGNVYHDRNREMVDIHIPVYSLYRRCLESVYLNFRSEDIANANIPAQMKDILAKIKPTLEFTNYEHYHNIHYENFGDNGNDNIPEDVDENDIDNVIDGSEDEEENGVLHNG